MDEVLDLFGLCHEVVHEFLLVGCWVGEKACKLREGGIKKKKKRHERIFTLEHVRGIDFVWIALLRDRDLGGDLREVRAGGEIRDAAGHDGKEL